MSIRDEFNDAAEEWYALEEGSFPALPSAEGGAVIAVRGLLPLPVQDTPGFRAASGVVEAALLILSQSPHARRMAQTALAQKYSVRIGSATQSSEWAEASGHTDIANRVIHAGAETDPLKLALVIAHELAHVAQADKGFNFSVTNKKPEAAMRELMVMEGDARAHEFIVALELAYKMPGDPDERLLFPAAIDAVSDSLGSDLTRKIIAHFRPQFPEIDRDEMMARVFKSFYGSLALRAHYEASVQTALNDPAVRLLDDSAFVKDFDAAAALQKLGGYAIKAAKYLDLDAPQMAGLTQSGQDGINQWRARRAAAATSAPTAKPKAAAP
ncbi:MAG TPA: DUF6782 family putative metallopeptidase [Patescibacteria group bacterium]|nr:DUF6782 family putative metallopeptidase [Patescibacteria group bacterium]